MKEEQLELNVNMKAVTKDMLHAKCEECKDGTYIEKSIWCDWGGEPLNCSNCDHEMDRHIETGEKHQY